MRYAVVYKTYAWDPFVHRQASRCAEATGSGGDFYISIDETNGSVGPVPFDRVIRTSNADLIGMGFANRFEKGSLLWWNADYAHYQFRALYPDYDYYVFVEYDAVLLGNYTAMVEWAASLQADYVALPLKTEGYFWTLPHRQVYELDDIRAALMCISIYSPRALKMMEARRREMQADSRTVYWPMAEVFLATEIHRAGYNAPSMAAFGDTSRYVWFPPMLEEDIPPQSDKPAFLHPVLDRQRYIRSIINNNTFFRSFIWWRSTLYKRLSRFPRKDYMALLPAAAKRWLRTSLEEKSKRLILYLSMFLPASRRRKS